MVSSDVGQAVPEFVHSGSAVEKSRERGVTPRVVVLSLVLGVFFGYVNPTVDFRFFNTYLGGSHLPTGAVGALLVLLVVVNPLLRLLSKRLSFSRNETLTVYITCLFSCLVPGRGGENFWIPNVLSSFYYATSENKWLGFLQPHLKPWLTPALGGGNGYSEANRYAVEGWYTSLPEGAALPWGAWLIPLVAWGAIVLAVYGMLACLGVMLRAQWAEREALAFPLLKLPLEMTQHLEEGGTGALSKSSFFSNPTMWCGFGVAVLIEGLNGLNLYFPEVPVVPLKIANVGAYFTEPPWNQVTIPLSILPLVVGVSFLLTSEVSFSLWFFFLFTKFQLILAYYMGFMPNAMPDAPWSPGLAKPFVSFQQIGAYFAYSGIVLWIGREHLGHIARRAFGREKAREAEKGEPLSYPLAFWGFVACFAFIIGWTVMAGVRADVALLMWVTYLVVAIGLTRVVVEGGLLMVHAGWAPLGPWAHLLGGGPGGWVTSSSAMSAALVTNSLMYEMRGFLLPSFVQSFKLAHDRRIKLKPLLALITVTILVTMAASWFTIIWSGYRYGGLQLPGVSWWARAGSWAPTRQAMEVAQGIEFNPQSWMWLGVGASLTWGIMLARSRFLWFPLHPIGYLMCTPYAMHQLWLSIFIAWLCKVLITRFGGNEAYRKTVPAFLGLALGEIAMTVLWVAIDGWQGRMSHILFPG